MKPFILITTLTIALSACGSGSGNSSNATVSSGEQSTQSAEVADTLAWSFLKKYSGTIGDLPIVLDITRTNEKLNGSYYYTKIGTPIVLEGSIKNNGAFEITEISNGNVTGFFEGIIPTKGGFSGTWKNAAKNKTLPLTLTEITDGFAQFSYEDREAKNCKHADKELDMSGSENGCTTLKVHFLTVNAASVETTSKINATLLANAGNGGFSQEKPSSLDQLMSMVNINSPEEGFNGDISFNVETNDNNVICITQSSNWYNFGAAHPNYFISFTNFDLRSGNIIQLEELLNPGFDRELNRIAEAKFLKDNGSEGWDFEPGNFKLNRNFAIQPGGLLFSFDPYEIGPYMAGAPSVFIPYKSIAKLIKPNGLLAAWVQ